MPFFSRRNAEVVLLPAQMLPSYNHKKFSYCYFSDVIVFIESPQMKLCIQHLQLCSISPDGIIYLGILTSFLPSSDFLYSNNCLCSELH